ncbi:BON domain-containing protein [Piscinibacter sp.]|jgi:osmotically-inducible protein OsmY|uniref:BON domain-containing protein n=1 Tax=Piscinibacter sp. TaxID=1903157 RepID=UPI0035597473
MANQESDISKEVRAAFEIDPRVDLHRFPIHVVNHGDRLSLEGEVESIAAKRVAIALAKRVSGMTRVIDALRLVPAEARGDGEIRDAFARSLLQQPELKNCNIRQRLRGRSDLLHETSDPDASGEIEFETVQGVITLTGSVISLSHKRMVEALAWWVPGCRDVVNQLEVVPAEEDNDDELADAIRLVFEMDPLVHADQIGIRAERGVVTLAGVLRRIEERRMAEMDAWSVCGVNEVHNQIEVSPT